MLCGFPGNGAEAPPLGRWGGVRVPDGAEAGLQGGHEESAMFHPAGRRPQRSELTNQESAADSPSCALILKSSLYFLSDVERYSDKYHLSDKMDGLTDWIIGEFNSIRNSSFQFSLV